jgi:hypothetical protein
MTAVSEAQVRYNRIPQRLMLVFRIEVDPHKRAVLQVRVNRWHGARSGEIVCRWASLPPGLGDWAKRDGRLARVFRFNSTRKFIYGMNNKLNPG